MKKAALFTIPILVLISSLAHGAGGAALPTGCIAETSTDKMAQCLNARLAAEDTLLQTVYDNLVRELISREKKPRAVLLTKAQLSWLRLRDNQCKFDFSVSEAGDQAGIAETICLTRETTARRLQLEQTLIHLVTGSVVPQ